MNAMEQKNKMVIYQVFPRWFGNNRPSPVKNGSLAENGVGKFSAFTPLALSKIKELGITHVWYTGVIEHATKTDYSAYGIRKDHSAVVKGNAGVPERLGEGSRIAEQGIDDEERGDENERPA